MSWKIAIVAAVIIAAGCTKAERELPVTELPKTPESAKIACQSLTDQEVITCLNGDTRDICRKVEYNCAVLRNLQGFVKRTWAQRDGK